jgi:hypothetical protein
MIVFLVLCGAQNEADEDRQHTTCVSCRCWIHLVLGLGLAAVLLLRLLRPIWQLIRTATSKLLVL